MISLFFHGDSNSQRFPQLCVRDNWPIEVWLFHNLVGLWLPAGWTDFCKWTAVASLDSALFLSASKLLRHNNERAAIFHLLKQSTSPLQGLIILCWTELELMKHFVTLWDRSCTSNCPTLPPQIHHVSYRPCVHVSHSLICFVLHIMEVLFNAKLFSAQQNLRHQSRKLRGTNLLN